MKPGVIARRSRSRGWSEGLNEAADMLDGLAGGLREALDRLGVDVVEQHLRVAAGTVRAQADQLRSASTESGSAAAGMGDGLGDPGLDATSSEDANEESGGGRTAGS